MWILWKGDRSQLGTSRTSRICLACCSAILVTCNLMASVTAIGIVEESEVKIAECKRKRKRNRSSAMWSVLGVAVIYGGHWSVKTGSDRKISPTSLCLGTREPHYWFERPASLLFQLISIKITLENKKKQMFWIDLFNYSMLDHTSGLTDQTLIDAPEIENVDNMMVKCGFYVFSWYEAQTWGWRLGKSDGIFILSVYLKNFSQPLTQ